MIPVQKELGLVPEIVTTGDGFTHTVPVAVAVQPAALVTVTPYTVLLTGDAEIGLVFWPEVQLYDTPPVAVSVAVWPLQITGLFTVGDGLGFTVTLYVWVVLQPLPALV